MSYATVVTLIVLGSIAVAAPSFRAALHAPAAASGTGATGSSGPADATGPVGGSGPVETPAPLAPGEGDGDGVAPEFTACEGLTGLDNAICRHEALLAVHPDNQGLQHSLGRLIENKAEHEAKQRSKGEGSEDHPGGGNGGNPHASEGSDSEGSAGSESDDPGQGNGNGNGHAKGHDEGAEED